MKTTVSSYDFQQAFTDANRAANFTSAAEIQRFINQWKEVLGL